MVSSHRLHAEMHLLNKMSSYTKKGNVHINVARVKKKNDMEYIFSLALPCVHCRKKLQRVSEYRRKKFGQKILLRYTTETGHFSTWSTISELPESTMSTGWRLKYNKCVV